MTESDWRKSKDGGALLAMAADRFTPRKWTLLACCVVRRVLHLLPAKPFHEAVDFVERRHPDANNGSVAVWRGVIEASLPDARLDAERSQHAVVKACDPDADQGPPLSADDDTTDPTAILFRESSHQAARSIEMAVSATESAATAARLLFDDDLVTQMETVRRTVLTAQDESAEAFIRGQIAFDLSGKAERFVSAPPSRRRNVLLSIAGGVVSDAQDEAERRSAQAGRQKQSAETAALAHLVREQLGNPFQPYHFEPSWRTETVVALASVIEAERAFDRMPILADALEEAGCDERPTLDHLRGPGPHARGCWVLDLILNRDLELFALPPLTSNPRRMQLGPFTPPPEGIA